MGQFRQYTDLLKQIRLYADDPQPIADAVAVFTAQYRTEIGKLLQCLPGCLPLLRLEEMRRDLSLMYQILEQERANENAKLIRLHWLRGTEQYQYLADVLTHYPDVFDADQILSSLEMEIVQ